jgi:hypothetical protein
MIYESREALENLLNTRYDGPISQREGPGGRTFSYIPWTETVRRLNKVFGADGWDIGTPVVSYNDGVYTVALALDVSVAYGSGDNEGYFHKSVPGVGSAVARGQGDDNASKAALSDAISRAAKLLGDQFGFFLYEEKGGTTSPTTRTTTSGTTSGTSSSSTERGPSPKQKAILTGALGFSEEDVAKMPFREWKAALDDHFAAKTGGF